MRMAKQDCFRGMPYFCYQCNRTVAADQHLHCSVCDGEFIEEIAAPPPPTHARPLFSFVVGGPAGVQANPVNSDGLPDFLRDLWSGVIPGSSNQPPPRANPPTGNDPFSQFINQLMANLSSGVPQGGQVHIQINRGNGTGISGNLNNYAFGDANFDQIITQLLNGYEQTVGLSKAELKRIPMVKTTQAHVDNGTQCTTCMDTFALNEDVAQLNCKHIFHKNCIVPWLERQKTCPICRQNVDSKEWPDAEKFTITDVDELD